MAAAVDTAAAMPQFLAGHRPPLPPPPLLLLRVAAADAALTLPCTYS